MKILLDECVDRRIASEILGHSVKSVHEMGWSGISNGELLVLAADEFDVFLTVDRNLSFQQPLPQFDIAVIVLRAQTNRLDELTRLIPNFLTIVEDAEPGEVTWVQI